MEEKSREQIIAELADRRRKASTPAESADAVADARAPDGPSAFVEAGGAIRLDGSTLVVMLPASFRLQVFARQSVDGKAFGVLKVVPQGPMPNNLRSDRVAVEVVPEGTPLGEYEAVRTPPRREAVIGAAFRQMAQEEEPVMRRVPGFPEPMATTAPADNVRSLDEARAKKGPQSEIEAVIATIAPMVAPILAQQSAEASARAAREERKEKLAELDLLLRIQRADALPSELEGTIKALVAELAVRDPATVS